MSALATEGAKVMPATDQPDTLPSIPYDVAEALIRNSGESEARRIDAQADKLSAEGREAEARERWLAAREVRAATANILQALMGEAIERRYL